MWLLDVNMPKKIVEILTEEGIAVDTAPRRGWRESTNGELVEAAARAGFTCIITRDSLFRESAAGVLRRFPQIGIVFVTIPQVRGGQYLDEFRRAWAKKPIKPQRGTLVYWPMK